MAAAAADRLLKSGEVSTMLRHGFPPSSPLSAASFSSPRRPSPSPSPSPPPATLFQMISREPPPPAPSSDHHRRRRRLHDRIARVLAPVSCPADVQLSVSSRDGFRFSLAAHCSILTARSRFFSENLSPCSPAAGAGASSSVAVDICECDDVEAYVEVVALMYCADLRRRLAGEGVRKTLGLLKVCVDILFDAGVAACLEHLEAVPWSEDEGKDVISVLSQLQLHEQGMEVLRRVSVEASGSATADPIFLRLLAGILQAKDEKARQEMKALVSRLLRDDKTDRKGSYDDRLDVSRESLYHLCCKCLNSLHLCLSEAATIDGSQQHRGALMGEIAREANNVQWLLEILIGKNMGDEFVMLWADQTELAALHSKIPCMYRYEISGITAQLGIALGRRQILVPKDARFSLLQTWLEPLYNDFGWMKRACRNFDKNMVEDGLCQTILTLPMAQQQVILLRWFDRFLKKGDDCPNIQRAFEIWWRRAFVRRYGDEDQDRSQSQVTLCEYNA